MSQTKITVKIYNNLLKAFDGDIERFCFKRDAFLNHMIKIETPNLAEEMKGLRLSSSARRHVSKELKRMGTTQINVLVEKETAEALNAVVDECNMVRDAFINRLIIYLRSSNSLLDFFGLPRAIATSEYEGWIEHMPTSPFGALGSMFNDPLYYLRTAAMERFETGLYLLDLPPKLVGFSCFLHDASVPGTEEQKETERLAEEALSSLLDQFEDDAFFKS